MKIKQLAVLVTCVVSTVVVLVCGCSLSVPKDGQNGHSLVIDLQEPPHETLLDQTFNDLIAGESASHSIRLMSSGPTSLSDFTCFAVDIAGTGIPADSGGQIANCTVQQGIAVGFIPNPVPRGQSISASVPGGTARTIYAFGIQSCDNGSTGSSGGSGGSGGGFLIGQVTQDIVADTSVTIPISYVSGTAAVVNCKDNGGNGCQGTQFPSPFVPQGGTNSTTIFFNTTGNYNGTTVKVGGSTCTNIVATDATHFSCQVPTGSGSQSVLVTDPCGNQFSAGNFNYTSSDFLFVADNSTLEADGSSFNFGQTSSLISHTFYISNSGATTANTLSVSVSGTYFTPGTDNCSGNNLSPGSNCTVVANFNPASSGPYTGTINVTSSGTSASRALAGSR